MKPLLSIRSALELLAPRDCAVCGLPVPAQARWPLCSACERALRPRTGAGSGADEEFCPVCGKALISEIGACLRCRQAGFDFDGGLALFPYASLPKDLLAAYKFAERKDLAPYLAGLVAAAWAARFPGRPIVPVPPRPGKIRRGGWDQVELLARILERKHGLPVERPLVRLAAGQQKMLGLLERRANASRAYRLRRGAAAPAFPVLLDDILTTGATLSSCAAALKRGGASRVDAIALAAD